MRAWPRSRQQETDTKLKKAAPQRLSEHPTAHAKTRKRVLLFTNSVAMGGMERHVELLARHLDRLSFEVFTICPSWPPIEPFDRTLRRVADHHWQCTPDRRWGINRELREAWALYRYLRAWRVDVIHLHLTAFRGGWWSLIAARAARIPVIVCTEHLAPESSVSPIRRLLRYGFVRSLSQLICVSERNRSARNQYLWTPPNRTSVVANGVDPEDFQPIDPSILHVLRCTLGIPEESQVAGSVVRLASDKGLEYLLESLPLVLAQCPDTYLLLVGEGPLRKELEAQAGTLGVRERVVFAGFQADPRSYLALLDAFVLPVPVGSMSIGLLEAMAMRCPVIISFGGPGEAVVHEKSGLCVPPRDSRALAEGIVRLLRNPVQAHAYGEAARQRVVESFSAADVAARLGTMYRALSEGTVRGSG